MISVALLLLSGFGLAERKQWRKVDKVQGPLYHFYSISEFNLWPRDHFYPITEFNCLFQLETFFF